MQYSGAWISLNWPSRKMAIPEDFYRTRFVSCFRPVFIALIAPIEYNINELINAQGGVHYYYYRI